MSENVKERQIQMWTSVPAKGRLPTAVDENVFRNLFHQVRDVVVELFRKTLLAMDPQPKKKKHSLADLHLWCKNMGPLHSAGILLEFIWLKCP